MCLVADDRPAKVRGSLIKVSPGPGHGLSGKGIHASVVFPNVGVQNRVFCAPHTAAMKLVRSGPGLNLNLSAATAHFRIDRRKDYLHFTNEVGMKFRRRVDAGRPALATDGDAVPLDIDVPRADSRKL